MPHDIHHLHAVWGGRSCGGDEEWRDPEDDALLVDCLLQSGAPEWVRGATGWTDEHGWSLSGPEVTGAVEDD